jgi:hypothetical protein
MGLRCPNAAADGNVRGGVLFFQWRKPKAFGWPSRSETIR